MKFHVNILHPLVQARSFRTLYCELFYAILQWIYIPQDNEGHYIQKWKWGLKHFSCWKKKNFLSQVFKPMVCKPRILLTKNHQKFKWPCNISLFLYSCIFIFILNKVALHFRNFEKSSLDWKMKRLFFAKLIVMQ